jgi:hypothetical protein
MASPIPAKADRPPAKDYDVSMFPAHDKARWLTEYRATAEALEHIGARELAEMTDEEALRRIASLTVCGRPWRERPDWSGLVEQQALFHRRRET